MLELAIGSFEFLYCSHTHSSWHGFLHWSSSPMQPLGADLAVDGGAAAGDHRSAQWL